MLDCNERAIEVVSSDTISYSATPNSEDARRLGNASSYSLTHINLQTGGRDTINQGLMSVEGRAGYSRLQVGEVRDLNTQNGMPKPFNIDPNVGDDYVEVYPDIEGGTMTRNLSAGALAADKATFMIQSYSVKTEEENKSGSRMLSRFNPRAYSLNFYNLSEQERDMLPFETEITDLTTWLDAPLDESTDGQGYFGSSLSAGDGSNFVVTHSVPRQPIFSLAALQHSFANGFNRVSKPTNHLVFSTSMSYPLQPQISHAIGNSLAPSVMPSDKTTHNLPNYADPLADHSYLANRELWDDYFFSGITPQDERAFGETRDQKTVASDFFTGVKALPVVRYLPDLGGLDSINKRNFFFVG